MEELAEDDILELGVSFLEILGENMRPPSKKLYLWRLFNIVSLIIPTSYTILSFKQASGDEYIQTIEGACILIHILVKYLVLIFYKSSIKELLDARSKFWKFERFGNEASQAKAVFKQVKLVQLIMTISVTFVIIMFWLRPYLEANMRFILACWIYPDSVVLEALVLACQYYVLGSALSIVLGYDYVYFAYVVHVTLQMRLLNYRLRTISVKTTMEELRECLQFHCFLLSLFKNINAVYFWMFLFHYVVTLGTGCTELYIVLTGKVDIREIVASMFYNMSLLIQFGYYAFPADILASEFREASDAIYASSWYKQDIKVQKVLLFTMVRAQRQKYMIAGGIVEMNADSFSSVIRKTFSFYALSKNVLNKE
ncbi:hypothetical protein Trydic_g17473 [Trypoxylus dichotomus]